jgi:2-dehydropantoate 2-reductase
VRLVVLGAGAVGSLLAARLASAGHSVLVVARPDHVAAIRAHGLAVTGTVERTVRIDADTALPRPLTADALFLTVKTFDLASAAADLGRATSAPLPTLLPQNGLGVEALAVGALERAGWRQPERWLVRAVSSVPATLLGPGRVREAGHGTMMLPGSDRSATAPVRLFRDLLLSAGVSVTLVPDLARDVWKKAILNAAVNPVTALHHVPNGELLSGPFRAEALTLLREAAKAAAAGGFAFPEGELVADFDRIVRATAENLSSMRQDLEQGRPTEVDAILGELLRTGAAHGLDLPNLRAAAEAVEEAARRGASARKPS